MRTAPISLQDLRRSLYVKAKAEPSWRFWGLYVHVCKMETLWEAYQMARRNDGAPGIDGVTFEAIEESGAESFLVQVRDELVTNTYRPMQARKKEIPKDGGKKGYRDAINTYKELKISASTYVGFSIFGLSGRRMYTGPQRFRALPVLRDDQVESPEILVASEDSLESLKILADLMWQAGGLEESPSMHQGKWDPFVER